MAICMLIIGLLAWKKEEEGEKVEIKNRIGRWRDMGKATVIDNYEFHRAVPQF